MNHTNRFLSLATMFLALCGTVAFAQDHTPNREGIAEARLKNEYSEHARRQQLTENYYQGLIDRYDVVIEWPEANPEAK
jgi:hypothetical protein